MTNNQLTDERIKELMHIGRYSYHVVCGREIADICTALEELQERRKAAMDSEPVAFINGAWTLVYYRPPKESGLKIGDKLYRHAQQPVVRPAPECEHQWRHGGANKLQNQKQCIKCGRVELDAQRAPVLPEIDRQAIADKVYGKCCRIPGATFYNAAEFAIDEVEACRAAMLQAGYAVRDLSTPVDPQVAEYEQNVMQAGNSPVIPDAIHDALLKALAAMEFMGDALNNLDAVCTEDVEFVSPAFDAVRNVLAVAPQEVKRES